MSVPPSTGGARPWCAGPRRAEHDRMSVTAALPAVLSTTSSTASSTTVSAVPAAGSAVAAAVLAALLGAAGAVAGGGARVLLRRLRRGARIPPPWCEAAVALAWGGTGAAAGAGTVSGRAVPVLLGLAWLAVAASAVDVAHRRLPDALTLPALPAALLLLAPLGGGAVLRGLAAAAVAVAAHGAVHLAAPGALGGGDVKLAAPVGAVLGAVSWEAVVLGGVLAALLSGLAAAAVLLRHGRRASPRSLPHGPSMLVACWLVAGSAALDGAVGARGP